MRRTIIWAMLVVARSLKAQQGGRGPVSPAPQSNDEPLPRIPVGFTSIFNRKDLTGWHVSRTNHHGTTPDYHVMPGGVLVATQNPLGAGGVLLSDKKYKDFEVYIEVKPTGDATAACSCTPMRPARRIR